MSNVIWIKDWLHRNQCVVSEPTFTGTEDSVGIPFGSWRTETGNWNGCTTYLLRSVSSVNFRPGEVEHVITVSVFA